MNKLTIKDAAEALGCSVATVRRKIKSGDIKAELQEGPYGETYFIDERDLVEVAEIKEVVQIKRELDINQMHSLFMGAMQTAIQPLVDQVKQQAEIIKEQNKRIESLSKAADLSQSVSAGDTELLKDINNRLDKQEEQARERDKKLMETIRELQQQKQKKWWIFWD